MSTDVTSSDVNSILHDLASPLTLVQLNLDKLCNEFYNLPPARISEFIETAIANLQQANDILVLSETLGGIYTNGEAFLLSEEIEEICNSYAPQLFASEIILNMDLAADQYFPNYKTHFYRILTNVIQNSLDALSEDLGYKKHLTISTARTTSKLRISIKDNGIGIKEDLLKKVLEKGFSTKDSSGLGLNIVQDLLDSYFGGTIKIANIASKGARVDLIIPLVNN